MVLRRHARTVPQFGSVASPYSRILDCEIRSVLYDYLELDQAAVVRDRAGTIRKTTLAA